MRFLSRRPFSMQLDSSGPRAEGRREEDREVIGLRESSIRPATVNCYQDGGGESCDPNQRPGKRRR